MVTLQKTRTTATKLIGPFENSSKAAILACLLITLIIATSLIIDAGSPKRIYSFDVHQDWRKFAAFLGVFIGGGLCGLLFSGIGQSGLRESASCFWVSIKDSSILLGTAGSLVFALFVWWLSARQTSPEDHGLYLIQHDPGGIFAAFMGFVTIIGFAFTLHDLREMRRRITTFPDLIDRLSAMLEKVDGEEVVRVLAYTPALGYIALEDSDFKKFYATLVNKKRSNGEPRADIVCLNEKDLKDWHDLFIGRRTRRKKFDVGSGTASSVPNEVRVEAGLVNRKLADAATKKGEHILRDLDSDETDARESSVKRLPFEFLPGYYFFLTADRAIVVAPLQLPFPKGAPKSTQQNLRGTVQMLGFETNDRAIIRDLGDLYESYKALPSSYVAEVTEPVKVGEFSKRWEDPQFIKEVTDKLIYQFNVARGAGGVASLTTEDRVRSHDYSKLLTNTDTMLELTFRVALKEEATNS